MTCIIGKSPPLHKKFNEAIALQLIRSRYKNCKELVFVQVQALQSDPEFRAKCTTLYEKGYKDWLIILGILNVLLNFKSREKYGANGATHPEHLIEVRALIKDQVYPTQHILEEIDRAIEVSFALALKSYGFELRSGGFLIKEVEKFLRDRMRHFEMDIPHVPMFGDPPGEWPVIK